MDKFKSYLSKELGIEFKSFIYAYCVLFYICCYQLLLHRYNVPILFMAEVIGTTYIMCYIQVYLLDNFDEADRYGGRQFIYTMIGTILYTMVAYLGKWFDHCIKAYVFFAVFMVFSYICVFFVYKIMRILDTKNLNLNLEAFKEKKRE